MLSRLCAGRYLLLASATCFFVRFERRLRCTIERKGDLVGVHVPPLSIQTLVENSIKYAAGPSRSGATIHVTVDGTGVDNVKVNVADDGPGFDLSALHAGHGLDNLSKRLEVLFGERASLVASRDAAGLTHAGFMLPRSNSFIPVQRDSAA